MFATIWRLGAMTSKSYDTKNKEQPQGYNWFTLDRSCLSLMVTIVWYVSTHCPMDYQLTCCGFSYGS